LSFVTVHLQKIVVRHAFPVVFTRHLFSTQNRALREALTRDGGVRRHRCLVLLDKGVLAASPKLPVQIRAYFDAHADALHLVRAPLALPGGGRLGALCLALFLAGLLATLLVPASGTPGVAAVAGAFYRAGALVFGGGHVVLPLLQHTVVDSGWVGRDTFLAGYGAAQAMPGPMFSLAAFLGAEVPLGWPAALGATVALLAIFLPGFLLLLAVLPAWARLSRHRLAGGTVAGANAAVLGLLAAAFYDPVWTQGVRTPADLVIAAVGFGLLTLARLPALWAVLWCVAATTGLHLVWP
jgi:chromate transporter